MISRRVFLGTLAGGLLAAPFAAEAQQAGKVPRIGFLQRTRNENVTAFTQALREAGYIEGQTVALETRIYGGSEDELPQLAAEMVVLKCDVIVAAAPYAINAAAKASSTIPIVGIDLESDPVASGWARSLSHPGRNVTGVFLDFPELGGKQIQLLKEAVPKLSRVAVLWDSAIGQLHFHEIKAAARSAGVLVQSFGIESPAGLETGFARAARQRPQGMIVMSSPKLLVLREEISRLALKHRLPTISLFTSFPQAGALMAYGPILTDMYKRAVIYVDRILKGAKAGDLPIERPARFEFIINLKTAKVLGLTIPQSLLLRADEVIHP